MSPSVHIRGGRIVDPESGRDGTGDLFIRDGRIARPPASLPPGTEIIDARGRVVVPAFLDIHVHLREPGDEDAETIETGSRAAARGGFAAVVAMPNTRPPLDSAERIALVRGCGDAAGLVSVLPAGCISRGRAGREAADWAAMADAGAVAFTDDGSTVASEELMLEAMKAAKHLGRVIMDHAQDPALGAEGVMHQGQFSNQWKLPGIPAASEVNIVRRDINLATRTGCRLHLQHVSARESAELIREARQRSLPVSGELTPHHLALTDADVQPDNTNFKMNPPLRSAEDREALIAAVIDGTLQAFATDHAPHTAAAKGRGFPKAPFGIVGLETAVGVTYTELVAAGRMDLTTWVRRWTAGPAQVLGLPPPTLREGSAGHVAILDLETPWTVQSDRFLSKSRNTPFEGRELTGRAVRTLLGGVTTWLER